jgi:hypothetical protein
MIGMVPFVLGISLLMRWLLLYAINDDYQSRLPSLLSGIGLLLVAVQIWSVAFLADLIAANRRVLEELRLRSKRLEFGRESDDDTTPTLGVRRAVLDDD